MALDPRAAVRRRAFRKFSGMSRPTKPYVRPEAPTKDQLRAMLAQAVRNTHVTDQAPGPKAMRRARPTKGGSAKLAAKGRKGRG